MSHIPPADIRNVTIAGHQASGKTMLAEAMLLCSKKINRLGSIEAGNTVSDYHASEKGRKISVHASLLHTEWLNHKINIIDTPGYQDFISESLAALRIGDFALIVVDAVSGVQIGTDQVWDYASQFQIPKMIVINGCDKEHSQFQKTLDDLKEHFGKNIIPMSLPINEGNGFNKVLDVMRTEEIDYKTDCSGQFTEKAAEGEWKDKVRELHKEVIEYVAESDDGLMEKFFENDTLSEEDLREGLHAAIQSQSFIPVFCTSATQNIGIARLLDIISKYGSSPADRKVVEAVSEEGSPTQVELESESPCCYVWKTLVEPHIGELSYFRMYSGEIQSGTELYNADHKLNEKIGQLYVMQGHKRIPVASLGAGDIGVTVKLKDTHTCDTLSSLEKHLVLSKTVYPKPNIHYALQISSKGDEDKLAQGLHVLHEEDPTFIFTNNAETKETVISGQGELHLEIIKNRLKRRFDVEISLSEPKIAYRETITAKASSKYRHKKQSGGAGQFAEVWMRIEPAERNAGIDFKHSLVGQNVDRVFVPSVEKGVYAACEEGILAQCHATDLKIDFYDGKMHPVDSKDVAFQIAGKAAFKEAFLNAKPILLEPISTVKIIIPEDYVGDVMGDLSSKRGKIMGVESEGAFQVILANIPQMELHRYSTKLRGITGGRGRHTEEFSHYEELQREVAQKVISEKSKN